MDYIDYIDYKRHIDWQHFYDWSQEKKYRLILMSTKAVQSFYEFEFHSSDILLFGRESAGVPDNIHQIVSHRLTIPMKKGVRSINLSSSVALVLGEGLRQTSSI